MSYSREYLEGLSERTGFAPDTIEKVLRLERLLGQVTRHGFLGPRLVLKGGTALNLFSGRAPRRVPGRADRPGWADAGPGLPVPRTHRGDGGGPRREDARPARPDRRSARTRWTWSWGPCSTGTRGRRSTTSADTWRRGSPLRLALSAPEREYVERLHWGEWRPELVVRGRPALLSRLLAHPALLWKVESARRRPEEMKGRRRVVQARPGDEAAAERRCELAELPHPPPWLGKPLRQLRQRYLAAFGSAPEPATLGRLWIVRELTGRKHDRVFAYDRYLTIPQEGTEPP